MIFDSINCFTLFHFALVFCMCLDDANAKAVHWQIESAMCYSCAVIRQSTFVDGPLNRIKGGHGRKEPFFLYPSRSVVTLRCVIMNLDRHPSTRYPSWCSGQHTSDNSRERKQIGPERGRGEPGSILGLGLLKAFVLFMPFWRPRHIACPRAPRPPTSSSGGA